LEHRNRGIGRALVDACRAAMRAEGIRMFSFVVFRENETGNAFWDALGATPRDELRYYNLPV
jgi:ribosomal protein S18 acetylase RimI-like enzyme